MKNFIFFYESFMNPTNNVPVTLETDAITTIPVLDDPLSSDEVVSQINQIKSDKACGPDGVPPGILKLLPAQLVLQIATLFNVISNSGNYPYEWSKAKFFTIFKNGSRAEPKNYRGINVINGMAKLYDMILCSRLQRWFEPYREQAGAQSGRGCLEHIVTLRILTDLARRKKKKLFVTFVDFAKAYDTVSRQMMLKVLRRLGCGIVMLGAIAAMYTVTESIVGTVAFMVTLGIRQGSPTSCILFIIYVNDMIKLIKQNCDNDGYLSWLHILMLMDDTVLLATNRDIMLRKISLLKKFCDDYSMTINMSKTKFFVINGNAEDYEPLRVDGLVVTRCNRYVYLGSPFTADGSVSKDVKEHADTVVKHIIKFTSFLNKNNDIPFIVKRRIFEAAVMSVVLYGCESWLNADLRPIAKLYNWALKSLLSVRGTTCNNLCYAEAGYPPVESLVKSRQRNFFKKMWYDRGNMVDDPLKFVMDLATSTRYSTRSYVLGLLQENIDDIQLGMDKVRDDIMVSQSSRKTTYREINPDLSVHNIYVSKHTISEHERVCFTRFRISAHSLAVEVGRWNRRGRGRLPLEERLCECGHIQTELHVTEQCILTQHIRENYNFTSIREILDGRRSDTESCHIVYLILSIYAR